MFNPETFAAFRYRDFRVLWAATFVRSAALALELVARAVLIVELTGSAVLLGAVLAAWMAPNLLLSPFAGVIVDRYPYRRVLIGSFLTNGAASGVLFVLLIVDQAQSWQVDCTVGAVGDWFCLLQSGPPGDAGRPSSSPPICVRLPRFRRPDRHR